MNRRGMLIAVFVLLALASPGFAAVTIDFGTGLAGVGGVYTLGNGSNGVPVGQATGTNIPIGVMNLDGLTGAYAVLNTPPHAAFVVTGGLLNFNTVTGTISITGSVTIDGPTPGVVSGTLLSGTITSFTADANGLHDATGPDTKNADLLTDLGIPGLQFGFFGFSLTTANKVDANGKGAISSTDIRNDGVPEPSSVALFGTMLVGCVAVLRRRWSAAR